MEADNHQVGQLGRPLDQDALPQGGVFAVHHKDLLGKFLRRNTGALVSPGELAGEDHRHNTVARVHLGLESLLELGGANLAGAGKLFALNQQLVKALVGQLLLVPVLLVSKGDGHRQDRNCRVIGRKNVRRGIGDDFDAHSVFLLLSALSARFALIFLSYWPLSGGSGYTK